MAPVAAARVKVEDSSGIMSCGDEVAHFVEHMFSVSNLSNLTDFHVDIRFSIRILTPESDLHVQSFYTFSQFFA